MFKRVTWFVAGAVTGAGGSVYAKRRWRLAAERYRPVAVVRTTAGRVKRRADDVGAAVHEGKVAMRQREAELRAQLDDRPSAPALDPIEGVAPQPPPSSGRPGPRRRARR